MSSTEATKETARQEAGHVAGTARDEVANVAGEAQHQARNVLDDARVMIDEQSRSQRDRMVDFARSMGDDLEQMAHNGPRGTTADLARQAASKVRHFGDRIDGREPSEILDDVRRFARQRPGTFLLGALAAGVVAGRLARGSKDARDGETHQGSSNTSRLTTLGDVGPVPGYSTGAPGTVSGAGHEPVDAGPVGTPAAPTRTTVTGNAADRDTPLYSETTGLTEERRP